MTAGAARQDSRTAGAQAIRRAMDIVRVVARRQRSGARLSEIALEAGLSLSTSHRIARSLTEERLLRYDETARSYHLGLFAFELGLATQGESSVVPYWREAIEEIVRQTRLTTYLMARSENEAVCLLCVQGTMAIRAMPVETGQRLPLGIGAGSLGILATLDDGEIDQILDANRTQLAHYGNWDSVAKQIRARIAQARIDGFVTSSGSVTAGLVGVGLPVLPSRGVMQLAISVSAVADTIDPGEARKFAVVINAAIQRRLAAS